MVLGYVGVNPHQKLLVCISSGCPLLVGSWGHQLRARSLGPACRPPAALVVSGLPGASDAPMWLRVDGT